MIALLQLLVRQLNNQSKKWRYLFYGYRYVAGFPIQAIWALRALVAVVLVFIWTVWPEAIYTLVALYVLFTAAKLIARVVANILAYFQLARPSTKNEKLTVAMHVVDATPPPIRQPVPNGDGWES